MTHPERDQDLLLFAHGALPPLRAALTRRHLAYCSDCRQRLNQFQATSHGLAGAIRGGQLPRWSFPAAGATFGVAALSFPLVNMAAQRFSKKRVMMAGAIMLAALMACTPVLHDVVTGWIIFTLAGVPIAILLAVPNAILADICAANARRTGERREAMFFGAQGLFQKLNLGLSSGLLAILFDVGGNSVEHPQGVMWSGPLAAVALVGSVLCFSRYPERDVIEARPPVTPSRA